MNVARNHGLLAFLNGSQMSLEMGLGSVQIIKRAPDTETFGEFQMMEIVSLRRRKSKQMITTVIIQCSQSGPS